MSEPLRYENTLINGGYGKYLPESHFDFFPGIVCIYDAVEEDVTYVNRKLSDILGFTVEEFLTFPGSLQSIVHQDDVQLYQQHLANVLTTKQNTQTVFTLRFNNKAGGCKYLKVTATVMESNLGKATQVLLFLENVTDQVRFEEDVAASRQLFDEAEKLILFGSWSWNAKSGQITCTEGLAELLEYKLDELHNVDIDFCIRHVLPECVDSLVAIASTAASRKEDFEAEYIIRTKGGKEKFVYTKGTPIVDKDGNLRRYVGITRDVTGKKNAEKEKERRIRELNRSNKELEEFAYVASHDMHEPLRKVLTFGEKIKNKYSQQLGDDGKIYLDRMVSAAQNMRSLIDNLLEFSRISRGERRFEKANLNLVLSEVLSDLELRIEETSTEIKIRELPTVEGVTSELRQLFNNLLSNAIKFRKKDVSPVITISSSKLSHKEKSEWLIPFNQTYYRITVQDNGIGFDSAYSEKIFEIFQRLNGKSEYSGSGIGLAICKKIVDSHDGMIFASGEPGVGSTFSILLPETQYH